jgi:uncharacterized protein
MIRKCPICGKPADSVRDEDFPFCSERCRLTDLGNWSSEKYVISQPAFDDSMFENLESDLSNPGEKEGNNVDNDDE